MKKIMILFCFVGTIYAQGGWELVRQGSMMEGSSAPDEIFFINENLGWLGGTQGVIYHTEDGGDTWVVQRDTTTGDITINDIFFISETKGWACGANGTIIYTNNAGATWSYANNTSTTETLNSIYFVDNNNGYACGNNGVMIKSTNGGLNWIVQVTNTLSNLGGLAFWDANKGFAFINSNVNGVLWTESGGFLWSVATLPIPAGASSARMYGCNVVHGTSYGWIAGYHGMVFKTTNRAKNWTLAANFYGSLFKIGYDVNFTDVNNGYVCGYDGNVFKTVDGGVSWDTLDPGINQTIKRLSVPDNQHVFTAANYLQLRKSINGGTDWTPMVDWPQVSFRGLGLADSLKISACSFGGDYTFSGDAGQSFSYPGSELIPNTGNQNCVYFYNQNLGFLAGLNGSISKSTDGGQSWSTVNVTGSDLSTIQNIHFVNASVGWACASSGYIYKTTDGGNNWSEIYDDGTDLVYDIYFVNEQLG